MCDIISNMKSLDNLKILRLNNSKMLNYDILPVNLEILIVDNMCTCNDCPQIFNDINEEIINFENVFMLYNVPLYVKQIILNFNYDFTHRLRDLDVHNYFFQKFTDYLQYLKIPFGCTIYVNDLKIL